MVLHSLHLHQKISSLHTKFKVYCIPTIQCLSVYHVKNKKELNYSCILFILKVLTWIPLYNHIIELYKCTSYMSKKKYKTEMNKMKRLKRLSLVWTEKNMFSKSTIIYPTSISLLNVWKTFKFSQISSLLTALSSKMLVSNSKNWWCFFCYFIYSIHGSFEFSVWTQI